MTKKELQRMLALAGIKQKTHLERMHEKWTNCKNTAQHAMIMWSLYLAVKVVTFIAPKSKVADRINHIFHVAAFYG